MHTQRLYNWQQAHKVLTDLAQWLKPRLLAGHQYALTIGEPPRSLDQNARLHAMLGDLSKQVEWAGKKRSRDVWKRLCVSAWLRAEKEHVEMLPAIDGHGIDVIYERTSRMSKAQLSSLMEYVSAWGDSKGVDWSHDQS